MSMHISKQKKIFENIRTACAIRNVPESALMAAIGVSAPAWKRMRYGSQSLSTYNLLLVCKELETSADYLLGLSTKLDITE